MPSIELRGIGFIVSVLSLWKPSSVPSPDGSNTEILSGPSGYIINKVWAMNVMFYSRDVFPNLKIFKLFLTVSVCGRLQVNAGARGAQGVSYSP